MNNKVLNHHQQYSPETFLLKTSTPKPQMNRYMSTMSQELLAVRLTRFWFQHDQFLYSM